MLLQKESSVSGFFCLSSGADGLTGVMPEGVGEGWEVGFAGVAGEEKKGPMATSSGLGRSHLPLPCGDLLCDGSPRGPCWPRWGARGTEEPQSCILWVALFDLLLRDPVSL